MVARFVKLSKSSENVWLLLKIYSTIWNSGPTSRKEPHSMIVELKRPRDVNNS